MQGDVDLEEEGADHLETLLQGDHVDLDDDEDDEEDNNQKEDPKKKLAPRPKNQTNDIFAQDELILFPSIEGEGTNTLKDKVFNFICNLNFNSFCP